MILANVIQKRFIGCASIFLLAATRLMGESLALGDHRELFCDRYLIESLRGAQLMLHEPKDEGPVLSFNETWEGPFSGYCTVIAERSRFRAYYRGKPAA